MDDLNYCRRIYAPMFLAATGIWRIVLRLNSEIKPEKGTFFRLNSIRIPGKLLEAK